MTEKKAAHENPLIPNARLKQMYRAILRAHLLGQALPPSQRALTAGREAALVSTSLDLTPRDHVLDPFSSPVLDFLRGIPLHRALSQAKDDRVPHPSSARVGLRHNSPSFWTAPHAVQNLRISSSVTTPRSLPAPSDPILRIQSALGAAAALQAAAALATKPGKQESRSAAADPSVVVVYTTSGEVSAETWEPALTFAAQHDLPIIFVVLPAPPAFKSSRRTSRAVDLRAIAHRDGVPAIPVDAADPVALYRVAQESIGHARIGGGPALIHCVAFPTPPSRTPPAIAHIEDYILSRGIATRAWMDREASTFATQVRPSKSASR